MKILTLTLATAVCGASAHAATWEYSWTAPAGETAPKVEISPLQYGKTWAYGFEIDDGSVSALTVAQPLFSQYFFTDAPPGIAGGKEKPFVGTAAIFLLRFDTGNSTLLDKQQTQELTKNGWGLINHSYWHSGVHWDKSKMNKPEDFRRELFWSQALWPQLLGDGRSTAQFVFPNGDYNYTPYLKEFGIRSGSRVSGQLSKLPANSDEWLDLNRNYLDEGVWSKKNDALEGLPTSPQAGDVVIDFTHDIDKDAASPNHKRWKERLQAIANKWGKAGDDSMWCAPTDDIVAYSLASKAAKVTAGRGKISVEVPDDLPGSALTLHLTGLNAAAKMVAPAGGTLYRRGDEAWITSPRIGKPGIAPPTPRLERIYEGEVKAVTLDKARRIAGVRLQQMGNPKADFKVSIDAVGADGGVTTVVPPEKATLGGGWGVWQLFPTIPDREAPLAKEIRVSPDPSLKKMEIWALAE